jgi:hypothetical protein
MEMSGQLHTLATLLPVKEFPVPVRKEDGNHNQSGCGSKIKTRPFQQIKS